LGFGLPLMSSAVGRAVRHYGCPMKHRLCKNEPTRKHKASRLTAGRRIESRHPHASRHADVCFAEPRRIFKKAKRQQGPAAKPALASKDQYAATTGPPNL